MKKLMKLALVAVLALTASTAFGQKFGRVDLAAIVPNMPEYKEAVTNLEAYGMDLQNQLEQIQVVMSWKGEFYAACKALYPREGGNVCTALGIPPQSSVR